VRDGLPRLVALDVDGTLLTSDHRVSPATREALGRARERGVEVLLATSRGPRALAPVLVEAGLAEAVDGAPAVFVASQGAFTGSRDAEGRLVVIRHRPMPLGAAREVVAAAAGRGLAVSWFAGDLWCVSHLDATIEAEALVVRDVPVVRDLLAEGTPPEKLMIISAELGALGDLAASLPPGLLAQASNPTYLEITAAGVDKAAAVREWCASRRIEARDVVAIGDGPNDLALFAFAGRSVAPANARPEVLAAATWVTAGNDEDGVAQALIKLLR
jgi:hypothetical protein